MAWSGSTGEGPHHYGDHARFTMEEQQQAQGGPDAKGVLYKTGAWRRQRCTRGRNWRRLVHPFPLNLLPPLPPHPAPPRPRRLAEMCHKFSTTGFCRYSDKCQFAHGEPELRTVVRHPKYKTEKCKTFWSYGHCPYGFRCRFLHDEPEAAGAPDARSASSASPLSVSGGEFSGSGARSAAGSVGDPAFTRRRSGSAPVPPVQGAGRGHYEAHATGGVGAMHIRIGGGAGGGDAAGGGGGRDDVAPLAAMAALNASLESRHGYADTRRRTLSSPPAPSAAALAGAPHAPGFLGMSVVQHLAARAAGAMSPPGSMGGASDSSHSSARSPSCGGGSTLGPRHSAPPRYKLDPCAAWLATGTCPYGRRCSFLHGDEAPADAAAAPIMSPGFAARSLLRPGAPPLPVLDVAQAGPSEHAYAAPARAAASGALVGYVYAPGSGSLLRVSPAAAARGQLDVYPPVHVGGGADGDGARVAAFAGGAGPFAGPLIRSSPAAGAPSPPGAGAAAPVAAVPFVPAGDAPGARHAADVYPPAAAGAPPPWVAAARHADMPAAAGRPATWPRSMGEAVRAAFAATPDELAAIAAGLDLGDEGKRPARASLPLHTPASAGAGAGEGVGAGGGAPPRRAPQRSVSFGARPVAAHEICGSAAAAAAAAAAVAVWDAGGAAPAAAAPWAGAVAAPRDAGGDDGDAEVDRRLAVFQRLMQ